MSDAGGFSKSLFDRLLIECPECRASTAWDVGPREAKFVTVICMACGTSFKVNPRDRTARKESAK